MKGYAKTFYPLYDKIFSCWESTLQFVETYIGLYYGVKDKECDENLHEDGELLEFYKLLLENCGVDVDRFDLKKFNICSMLTHFICTASVWNSHLFGCVSFSYLVHPQFVGLKICNAQSKQNTAQQFIEYCCLALCTGFGCANNGNDWKKVLLNDHNRKTNEVLFDKYFAMKWKGKRQKYEIIPANDASSIML